MPDETMQKAMMKLNPNMTTAQRYAIFRETIIIKSVNRWEDSSCGTITRFEKDPAVKPIRRWKKKKK